MKVVYKKQLTYQQANVILLALNQRLATTRSLKNYYEGQGDLSFSNLYVDEIDELQNLISLLGDLGNFTAVKDNDR